MVYDYIFCGYGLSAMLLADRLARDGHFDDKNVLLLDGGSLEQKTWCYWEAGKGNLDKAVSKEWSKALFVSDTNIEVLENHYCYKMIAPTALRRLCEARLSEFPNIIHHNDVVTDIKDSGGHARVRTLNSGYFDGKKIFSSIAPKIADSKRHPLLLQHFAGWVVRVEKPIFNDTLATFMDFSIPQSGNTRFMYVLPVSATEALFEYTLFSSALLDEQAYEQGIAQYLMEAGITDYQIVRKEVGVIPMTSYPFWKKNTRNVLHIGTAGGWTKPSTGYTLVCAQRWAERISHRISTSDIDFANAKKKGRFAWYDEIFISVLYHHNDQGKRIFKSLFEKNAPWRVLRFLREESSLWDEIKIIWSCPKRLFIHHMLRIMLIRARLM